MAVQECPNCFLKILPTAEGTCPSCQCNLAKAAACDRDQSTVWITKKTLLPQICCSCGAVTSRKVRIDVDEFGESTESSGGAWVFSIFTALTALCFGWLVLWFPDDNESGKRSRVISGQIPQCPSCRARNRPIVPEIDFDHGAIKVVVHDRFAREFEKLNQTE